MEFLRNRILLHFCCGIEEEGRTCSKQPSNHNGMTIIIKMESIFSSFLFSFFFFLTRIFDNPPPYPTIERLVLINGESKWGRFENEEERKRERGRIYFPRASSVNGEDIAAPFFNSKSNGLGPHPTNGGAAILDPSARAIFPPTVAAVLVLFPWSRH